MSVDRFTEILTELSELLGTDLRPDVRGLCKLYVNAHLSVQLEPQATQERLLLASFLCDIPPGKFRENILKDALKANWPSPVNGTLSYSERNNKLSLFLYLSTVNLSAQRLLDTLNAFIAKAETWRAAVETGQTSHLVPMKKETSSTSTGMFGIK